jgi:hypothetical protein
VYVGNATQRFYDVFPEGHPDTAVINRFLAMFNRPEPYIDEDGNEEGGLDEDLAKWMHKQLKDTQMKEYTRYYLACLLYGIIDHQDRIFGYETTKEVRYFSEQKDEWTTKKIGVHHDGLVEVALKGIECCWAKELKRDAIKKVMAQPMTALLLKKEKEWKQKVEEGFSVYSSIRQFGQLLFTEFRSQMTSFHWAKYRRIRDQHAPCIILKGIDINRAGLNDLKKALRDDTKAEKLWFARPFTNLEEARAKGVVDGSCFADDEPSDKIVTWLEGHTKIAKENTNMARINDVRRVLFKMQQEEKGNLTENQWGNIWRYYRICKQDVQKAINSA